MHQVNGAAFVGVTCFALIREYSASMKIGGMNSLSSRDPPKKEVSIKTRNTGRARATLSEKEKR